MRLTRLFLLTTTVLLGLVSLMLVRATVADWRTLQAAEQGLAVMERTYLAMKVAEKASAERGPANVVLGDTQPPDPPSARGWRSSAASPTSPSWTCCRRCRASTMPTAHPPARELERARQQVGRPPARSWTAWPPLPLAERNLATTNLTRRAVAGMFAVIDTLLGPVTTLSASAGGCLPRAGHALVGARYAAELREYAGRLGSQFAAPLAAQTPLEQPGAPQHPGAGRAHRAAAQADHPAGARQPGQCRAASRHRHHAGALLDEAQPWSSASPKPAWPASPMASTRPASSPAMCRR